MSARPNVGDRMQITGEERFGINTATFYDDLLLCQVICFVPGTKQAAIDRADDQASYNLHEVSPPPTDQKARREFLESIAYVGIKGNNLAIVQTRAISARDIETYFLWFLCQTGALRSGAAFYLNDAHAGLLKDDVAAARVRGVTFGAPVSTQETPHPDDPRQIVHKLDKTAGEILKAFFGDKFGAFDFEQSLEDDNIEMAISVKVHGRRLATESGAKLMAAIGRATRHIDERDFEIDVDGIGTLDSRSAKSERFRPRRKFNVKLTSSGGLMEEAELAAHLRDWLNELVQKKLVSP